MRIIWLNDTHTEAYIYRGFFKKERALVYTRNGSDWFYKTNDYPVEDWAEICLQSDYYKIKHERRWKNVWEPVEKLPKALVVKR